MFSFTRFLPIQESKGPSRDDSHQMAKKFFTFNNIQVILFFLKGPSIDPVIIHTNPAHILSVSFKEAFLKLFSSGDHSD